MGEEVFGMNLLEQIGETIYQDLDPTGVYHLENPLEVTDIKNGYQVKMKIPFIKEEEFTLKKFGDELIINLNNRRKSLFLPKFANYMVMADYSYENPWLTIDLKKD